ncbi:unnamed protein product [Allacma fusca]|uniref:Uncharacterized protein n=1 Tax=Allacma fusca TaxID=39272 RepID=A0A8J2LA55_9HEXA|nr:unnamed protein product [Allacma fusca]
MSCFRFVCTSKLIQLKKIKYNLKLTSELCQSALPNPFEFHYTNDVLKLKPKASLDFLMFLGQIVTLYFYLFHYILQLFLSSEHFGRNLDDASVHVFYLLCWIGFASYKKNLLKNDHSITWLYNQIVRVNKSHGIERSRSTLIEQAMMSWLPSQLNCILGTMMMFMQGSSKNQYLYCYFRGSPGNIIFGLCFCCEFLNILAAAGSAIIEFYLHAFAIRSFNFWANKL